MEVSTEAMLARAHYFLAVPLQHALGAFLLDEQDPVAGVGFVVGELASNGAGGLHAAALGTMMELAGYFAILPVLAEDEHAVTHSITTQLSAGALQGDTVSVRGALDRRTRRLAFVSVTAQVDERIVARSQIVKSIVKRTGAP